MQLRNWHRGFVCLGVAAIFAVTMVVLFNLNNLESGLLGGICGYVSYDIYQDWVEF